MEEREEEEGREVRNKQEMGLRDGRGTKKTKLTQGDKKNTNRCIDQQRNLQEGEVKAAEKDQTQRCGGLEA